MNLFEKLVTAWQSVDFLLNRVWADSKSFIHSFLRGYSDNTVPSARVMVYPF